MVATDDVVPVRVAVLDDYQGVALTFADWSRLGDRVLVATYADHVADPDALVARLIDASVLCVMRERTPLPRAVLERLTALKLIVSTGRRNASIDLDAADELGITVVNTGGSGAGPAELTWALIQASARNLTAEVAAVRAGGWQLTVGEELAGRTLGILGLGRIGSKIARIATAFDMDVITWSRGMTQERALEAGARAVSKEELFAAADILTIHLPLADGTRALVGAAELAAMKPSAWLVNTSRGPIVDEAALLTALREGTIRGAALDVFGTEPLPLDDPLRTLPNVVATAHIGYVTRQSYEVFFRDTVAAIESWLAADV